MLANISDTSAVSAAIGDHLLASYDLALRMEMWRILCPWLESHGYYLYREVDSNFSMQERRRLVLPKKPVKYPIAHVGDKSFAARHFPHMVSLLACYP